MSRSIFFCIIATCILTLADLSSAGTITHHSFNSGTLGRAYEYNVYLPDGYATDGVAYPVLYLLHGSNGDEGDWPTEGNVQQTVDYLVETGDIPPAIVIMPGSKSWWVDGNNESAKTAFFEDLIPHVEATFRAISERTGRLVAGLSAGGYGTINFVLEYPGMFAAGAALSPASYVPYPPPTSSAQRHPTFLTASGKFDRDLWQRLNYTEYIETYKAQDVIVPIYINSGDHDAFDIAFHAAVLYQTLREHQPNRVEFRVVDGDHEWAVWADSLPDALTYIFQFASRPKDSSRPD